MPLPRQWVSLFAFLALTLGVLAVGSIATQSSVGSWYPTLAKPAWTPPAWLFAPVWTILYVLIAIVGWRLWLRREHSDTPRSLAVLWFVQLALNGAWPPAFFGLRNVVAGLFVIGSLWLTLLVMQLRLVRADRAGAALWVPYLLWVSFATALNTAIWRLNA